MITKARIESIGTYLPEKVVSNDELVRSNPALNGEIIAKVTGVEYRRVCDKDTEDSHRLGLKAAKSCLNDSRYTASDLEVVIVTSISKTRKSLDRNYMEPSAAAVLAKELGVTKALHFDVVNACAGLSTGILILNNLIVSGRYKNGIVVSGETVAPTADNAVSEMTSSFDPQFAALTVGDAGAAVIIDKAVDEMNMISFIKLFTKANDAHLCIAKPSDKRASPALYTDPELGSTASTKHADYVISLTNKMLGDRGTSIDKQTVDYLILHQVAQQLAAEIVKRCDAAFYMNRKHFETLSTLEKYGNTSSASLIITLNDGIQRGLLKGTNNVMIMPMASGFVAGVLLVTITK